MNRLVRLSLVEEVEQRLEQALAEGKLFAGGTLPSERLLAERLGVSRPTVREAFLRLELRGVVGVRKGRRARVRGYDELLTLELLGVLLGKQGTTWPERRQHLQGILEQKRLTTLELLERTREEASSRSKEKVLDACFDLREKARWSERAGPVVECEFALLRVAAEAVDSSRQLLLVNSLKRGFDGLAPLLHPWIPIRLVCKWAERAYGLLAETAPTSIRAELLPLIEAVDVHVLEQVCGPASTDDGNDPQYAD
ncbi:MAG: GntR family transcriptional regulator [Myxococcaceae bacterium]|nr:GntR family transcriptional regulator [Myxococcaceae bacterium]